MKITKRQLRRIIKEEISNISLHTIPPTDPRHRNTTAAEHFQIAKKNEVAADELMDDHLYGMLMPKDWDRTHTMHRDLEQSHRDAAKKKSKEAIREAAGKAAPFGSGMEQADLDAEEEELIGHE